MDKQTYSKTIERVKEEMKDWPEWKKEFLVTKYSDQNTQKQAVSVDIQCERQSANKVE